ncbi:DNA-binding transcriptional LysR family regulator [Sphingomonas sp. UYAg733]
MRLVNLDMDALRSFVLGVDAGSFAAAAGRLGRSSSAVSAHLRKLEGQAGVVLVRKSGRGLSLTDGGETLLPYARRLLELNDEAAGAVREVALEGWVRFGLPEDFGEKILPGVLGRFARAHPKVRIEGRIARNSELTSKIAAAQLDLALVWDDGLGSTGGERIAAVPLCWLGAARAHGQTVWQASSGEPVPLVALEAPCLLRTMACEALDQAGLPWRIAFVSPSLGGLWAATGAGLGIALRTPVGHPESVRALDAAASGLPELPSLNLALLRGREVGATAGHLAAIAAAALREALPARWLTAVDSSLGDDRARAE